MPQHELTSDDYYTPSWVFERMGLEFDLDVCAPPGGGPFVPAARYLTQAEDGLAATWSGRVWMNPPFSDCAPWVRRFIGHAHGVCVVQVSKSRHSEALWSAAHAVAFVGGFPFHDPTTGTEGQVYMPCWFAAFGEECVEAIARLGTVRVRR
jgi:hypothetical protein